ncbi:MAG: PAS domain S-box protein, partial [Vicinamibacterales bacterium]
MRDTRERYQQLVEGSPDGILATDRGHVTFLNRAAAQLVGAPSQAIVGRSILDIFDPACRSRLSAHLDTLRAGHAHARIDLGLSKTGDTAIDVELSAARDASDADVVYLFLRDVTDRVRAETAVRESEERLSLAVAGAQEGVWDW